jgi:hypothetical protein
MARQPILTISQEGAPRRYTETKSITLSGSNATVATPIFRVTGTVKVTGLYGVVTTALGSNITAAHWRTNDQTATLPISAAAGTTLSSFAAGSTLTRKSLVSVALTGDNASAAKVIDPVAATAPDVPMPFVVVQKTGGVNTDIEFVYTTTNTPTSGAITFYCTFEPVTSDGDLRAV